MDLLGLIILGFAPGIFWLWQIYQRDKYVPVPPRLVVRAFAWGVAVSVPVVLVEGILIKLGGLRFGEGLEQGATTLVEAAYVSFIVAGLTEEFAKYLAVKRTVYSSPYFRQPLDGIIFSAAAALGFASIENVGYILIFGRSVILIRGPFSTLAHVLFSIVWGYSLGARKLGKLWPKAVGLSVVIAMVLHGLFDFFILAGPTYSPWALILFIGMIMFFFLILRDAQRESPYRDKIAAVQITCPDCAHRSGYGATFCTACGRLLTSAKFGALLLCGRCNSLVEGHHQFCTECGSRLNRKLASVQMH